jgi:hypothetical protein
MNISRDNMTDLLYEVLKDMGGKGTIVEVCKAFWEKHENDLRRSGEWFYKWQYEIRWAATELRREKLLKPAEYSPKGLWELNSKYLS